MADEPDVATRGYHPISLPTRVPKDSLLLYSLDRIHRTQDSRIMF
jgi:hypothetical protein